MIINPIQRLTTRKSVVNGILKVHKSKVMLCITAGSGSGRASGSLDM